MLKKALLVLATLCAVSTSAAWYLWCERDNLQETIRTLSESVQRLEALRKADATARAEQERLIEEAKHAADKKYTELDKVATLGDSLDDDAFLNALCGLLTNNENGSCSAAREFFGTASNAGNAAKPNTKP